MVDKQKDKNNPISGEFMELFEHWERYLRVRFKNDSMYQNTRDFWDREKSRCQQIGVSESDLLGFFNLRNLSVHTPSFAEPQEPALVKLQRVVNTFSKKALDIATLEEDIYKAGLDVTVKQIVKKMNQKDFSYVPIIERDEFVGVFSERTLVNLVADESYHSQAKVEQIRDLLEETGEDYVFLPVNVDFYRIYQMFQEYISQPNRLKAIFLTENGKPSSNIKGMITASDLYKGRE